MNQMQWELPIRWGTQPTLLELGGHMGVGAEGDLLFDPNTPRPPPPPNAPHNPNITDPGAPPPVQFTPSPFSRAFVPAGSPMPGTRLPGQSSAQEETKIPTWAYFAGGAAILGVGYLLFRKKGRR